MKAVKESLVLYKQAPAVVSAVGEKLQITLPGGKSRLVREKDVVPLHPGPVKGFPDLETGSPEGQPREAWELLQGEAPTLAELADLVFGEYTPSTAWLAFKLLNRSPWFRGTPGAIEVVDAKAAEARIRADKEKAEAARRWEDFIARFRERKINIEEDEIFLRDLEMYALGRSKGSRILKALGKTQSPENAHRVMLKYGVKEPAWNPHPLRLDVPLDVPDYPLGDSEGQLSGDPGDDSALKPADESPGAPGEAGTPGQAARLDLTQVEAFAIDDEGSSDPDDAVAWDGCRLWVHVADAASLIPAGSPADQAARERSSSVYLPEKVIPMLPKEAARRLGLGLQSTSPALSYAFGFDDNLQVNDFSIHLTTVRVTRLTYKEADRRMDREPLASIKRITDAAARRRERAGAVTIRMPEVKILVDDSGEISITPLPELSSRRLVAEAMLMAGAHAAEFCRREGIAVPFAVQDGGASAAEAAASVEAKIEAGAAAGEGAALVEARGGAKVEAGAAVPERAPLAGGGLGSAPGAASAEGGAGGEAPAAEGAPSAGGGLSAAPGAPSTEAAGGGLCSAPGAASAEVGLQQSAEMSGAAASESEALDPPPADPRPAAEPSADPPSADSPSAAQPLADPPLADSPPAAPEARSAFVGGAERESSQTETPNYVEEFEKRRGMKRSRTTLECGPHSGLGLSAYTRVTSPLRRYPDLIASRQIRSRICGRPPEDPESVLAGLAAFESRSGSLVQAERRSNLFWKLQWLARRPGWSTQAWLLDRRERAGLFLIPEIALEVRAALKTPLRPGDRATLKLKEVDIPESTALFIIQETH